MQASAWNTQSIYCCGTKNSCTFLELPNTAPPPASALGCYSGFFLCSMETSHSLIIIIIIIINVLFIILWHFHSLLLSWVFMLSYFSSLGFLPLVHLMCPLQRSISRGKAKSFLVPTEKKLLILKVSLMAPAGASVGFAFLLTLLNRLVCNIRF